MSETRRPTRLFVATLVLLAVIAAGASWYVLRKPSMTVDETVRRFLDAARAQQFEVAKQYCTPDVAQHAIRSWMTGGFEYTLNEIENPTASSADIEAEITKGTTRFILRFGLYNGDNRWRINMMMVSR